MFRFLFGIKIGKRAERSATNIFAGLLVISLIASTMRPFVSLAQSAEETTPVAEEVQAPAAASSESSEAGEQATEQEQQPVEEPAAAQSEEAVSTEAAEIASTTAEAPSESAVTATSTGSDAADRAVDTTVSTSTDRASDKASDESASTTSTAAASELEEEPQGAEAGSSGTSTENGDDADATDATSSTDSTPPSVPSGGGGSPQAGGGSATVNTGDAVGVANIVNVVNTGIFNSVGALMFLSNIFGQLGGMLDLRDLFGSIFGGHAASTTPACSLEACSSPAVAADISASSTARIVNDVVVRAMTGGNKAVANDGSASIETGDAYAAANVINVANTNITNSNYLLVSMTNFGDVSGDIVLPNKSFFEKLFFGPSTRSGQAGSVNVENNNSADVANGLEVVGDTGSNSASSTDGTAAIRTGEARTSGDVTNSINRNIFNSNALVLLFRVYGDWNGNVFGAPNGIRWRESGNGIELWNDPSRATSTLTASAGDGVNCCDGLGSIDVENNNKALITNNIQVLALTGDNHAEGAEGASVASGDAYAAGNIVNIANTNIFGSNFIFAIFNIFGNWKGNISFGQPDLWIGGRVETSEGKVTRGGNARFNFTIANRGDADAHGVRLRSKFPSRIFDFHDAMEGDAVASWDIGTIPAGQVVEVSYDAKVGEVPMGESVIDTNATVESDESDGNSADNTETMSLLATSGSWSDGSGAHVTYTPDPDLRVTKTNSAYGALTASSSVDYTISIENVGEGPAYHSTLTDSIKSQDGEVIYTQDWPLGTIAAGEEITVTYRVEYNAETKPGTYVNSAQVKAIGRHPSRDPFYGSVADSEVALSAIQIAEGEPGGSAGVSGVSDATSASTTETGVGGIGGDESMTEDASTTPENGTETSTAAATVPTPDESDEWLTPAEEDEESSTIGDILPSFGPAEQAEAAGFGPLDIETPGSPSFLQSAVAALAGDAPYWIAGAALAFFLLALGLRRRSFRRW